MTQLGKTIYNTYLRISRTKQNKLFKYRKNFDRFDDNPNFLFVRKLCSFFTKFPHISVEDFFNAPYNVYLDESPYYDLKYYTTPKAIRVYGLYMKQKDTEHPDCESQLNMIKQSLLFIFTFCRDNKLGIHEYLDHKTNNFPTFVLHLRQRDVTIYVLYGFASFEVKLRSTPTDRLRFTLGDQFVDTMSSFKLKYYDSKKAKRITEQGIQKIKYILNNTNNKL